MLNNFLRPTRLRSRNLLHGFVLMLCMSIASGPCQAGDILRSSADGTISIAAAGIVPLSDAAMSETTARGAQSAVPGAPAGNQPAVTLWDEIKPMPQPVTSAGGIVTVTVNGLPAR
jgi:hypothetical protein